MEREKQKDISRPDHCLLSPKTNQNDHLGMFDENECHASSSRHDISEQGSDTLARKKADSSFLKVSKPNEIYWKQYSDNISMLLL